MRTDDVIGLEAATCFTHSRIIFNNIRYTHTYYIYVYLYLYIMIQKPCYYSVYSISGNKVLLGLCLY